MTEFIPCRKCYHEPTERVPVGFYFDNGHLSECAHHKKWRLAQRGEAIYKKGGFDLSFFENTKDSYKGEKSKANIDRIVNYLKAYKDAQQYFIYFYGNNGTQKTATASWMAANLAKRGYTVKYTLMKSLIDLLWESQRNDENKIEVEDFLNADFLVIDEAFSKDKIHLWQSGLQIGYIDEFIRKRITKNKGILFISNTKPEEISAQGFSDSIQNLISRELKKQSGLMEFKDNYFDSVEKLPERIF